VDVRRIRCKYKIFIHHVMRSPIILLFQTGGVPSMCVSLSYDRFRSLLLLLPPPLLHLFNGLFSRSTWVSRHHKGKPFGILLEQETMGWQWHKLDHMQIIWTSLQTDNHTSTSPLSFYRPDALPAAQPTASKH